MVTCTFRLTRCVWTLLLCPFSFACMNGGIHCIALALCAHYVYFYVSVILDEDNWRNDYPDEEESPHSSDSEGERNWKGHDVDGMCNHTIMMT